MKFYLGGKKKRKEKVHFVLAGKHSRKKPEKQPTKHELPSHDLGTAAWGLAAGTRRTPIAQIVAGIPST